MGAVEEEGRQLGGSKVAGEKARVEEEEGWLLKAVLKHRDQAGVDVAEEQIWLVGEEEELVGEEQELVGEDKVLGGLTAQGANVEVNI